MPNRTATSQNETAAPTSEPTAPHAKAKPTPRMGLASFVEGAAKVALSKAVAEAEGGGDRAWLITVTASDSGSTVLQHAS